MRISLIILMISSLVFSVGEAQAQSLDDRSEILSVLESWDQGWRDKDVELAISDYAEQTDWTNAFGDRFTSREELSDFLEGLFTLDFVMAGEGQDYEFTDIDFLSPTVALLRSKHVRAGQQFNTGEVRPDREMHHLRVLEKTDDQWLIRSHLIMQSQTER